MGVQPPSPPGVASQTDANIEQAVKQQLRTRYYRALNYLSIYLFLIVVYGGALLTDYFLILLIEWLLKEDIQRYPIVAQWFDYARTGLGLLLIVLAVTHGVISTISQVRLDLEIARED